MKFDLTIDQGSYSVDVDPAKPLLWVLREDLGIQNAKFGCGRGACGACTLLVGTTSVRACVFPVSSVAGREVTTIAGLNDELGLALKEAWNEVDVPQCGYCQPGFIMGAHSLLSKQQPGEAPALEELTNVCRCGTYARVRKAINQAWTRVQAGKE